MILNSAIIYFKRHVSVSPNQIVRILRTKFMKRSPPREGQIVYSFRSRETRNRHATFSWPYSVYSVAVNLLRIGRQPTAIRRPYIGKRICNFSIDLVVRGPSCNRKFITSVLAPSPCPPRGQWPSDTRSWLSASF